MTKMLDVFAESLAEKFHNTYERLAPYFNYKTRESSSVSWCDVPSNNKKLMIAVCKELLQSSVKSQSKGFFDKLPLNIDRVFVMAKTNCGCEVYAPILEGDDDKVKNRELWDELNET